MHWFDFKPPAVKSERGFKHDGCGRQLRPADEDWDDPTYVVLSLADTSRAEAFKVSVPAFVSMGLFTTVCLAISGHRGLKASTRMTSGMVSVAASSSFKYVLPCSKVQTLMFQCAVGVLLRYYYRARSLVGRIVLRATVLLSFSMRNTSTFRSSSTSQRWYAPLTSSHIVWHPGPEGPAQL